MPIRKLNNGRWQVDLRLSPDKRVRKQFKTRLEATRFEQFLLTKNEKSKDWLGKTDPRRLSELIELWYNMHGLNLRDGHKRLAKLKLICAALSDPIAKRIKASDFATYRQARLASRITPKTLNNELGYLRAVYNELYSLSEIDYPNPLEKVKTLQIPESALTFLTSKQINTLLTSISETCENPHVLLITKICLSTGCRWSEAENINDKMLKKNLLTFAGTKNGRVRNVPISPELSNELVAHWKLHGPFTSSLSSFRRALDRTDIELPRGQASHVLRHTFASYFVQNGGSILNLQKILGHSSLVMTMRYAHLAPDHLADALSLNPLQCGKILRNAQA